jgi:cytosine/adenosine deaminase-related metal-dependent hydrolase
MGCNGALILPDWMILSAQESPRKGWGVRLLGTQITELGTHAELRQRFPDDEVCEAPGQVLAPGFVDAHTHLYGVLAHGIPLSKAPSGFWPFLTDFWWPLVEDGLDVSMICAASAYNCAQMVRGGITAFYDCTEAPFALPGVLAAQAEVVGKIGQRATLSFEATQRVSDANGELGLKENLDCIRACRQAGGLLQGMMCFHTTFTCSDVFIRRAFDLAAEHDVLTHMHVSEGTYEPNVMLQRNGLRTIEYYSGLGVAGPGMLASQCVQINPHEIDLLAEHGVRVSHMPLSNCEVGGGIAPVPQMVASGVTVGLGSDGYLTDFFEIMRGVFLIHKAAHIDPRVMPAGQVWHLATEGGARALGLEKVGRIETGWQADLQLIEPHLPTPLEVHNLMEQLLLYCSRRDVRTVWVAGSCLVDDGLVIGTDQEQLAAHCREQAARLWARVEE